MTAEKIWSHWSEKWVEDRNQSSGAGSVWDKSWIKKLCDTFWDRYFASSVPCWAVILFYLCRQTRAWIACGISKLSV